MSDRKLIRPSMNEMMEKYPKIAYFEKVNPTWREGTELPCTCELTFASIIYAGCRQVYKMLINPFVKKS